MATVEEQVADGIREVLEDLVEDFRRANPHPLLSLIEESLQEHHADHYALERAPDGDPWQELAPATVARKQSNKILVEFDDMRTSLTGRTGDSIRRRSVDGKGFELIFGTRDLKAQYHQEGTVHIPQREHVGMSQEYVDRTEIDVLDYYVEELTDGV